MFINCLFQLFMFISREFFKDNLGNDFKKWFPKLSFKNFLYHIINFKPNLNIKNNDLLLCFIIIYSLIFLLKKKKTKYKGLDPH